jgi:ankyrin repeat protein
VQLHRKEEIEQALQVLGRTIQFSEKHILEALSCQNRPLVQALFQKISPIDTATVEATVLSLGVRFFLELADNHPQKCIPHYPEALRVAVSHNKTDALPRLLARVSPTFVLSYRYLGGDTLFHLAARKGYEVALRALLNHVNDRIRVNQIRNRQRLTPLDLAALSQATGTVQLLYRRGIDRITLSTDAVTLLPIEIRTLLSRSFAKSLSGYNQDIKEHVLSILLGIPSPTPSLETHYTVG